MASKKLNKPTIRQRVVNKFIKDFKAEEESAEEYALNEDSCLGEFVASFGYGDGTVSFEYASDELKQAIEEFLQFKPVRDLVPFCSVEVCGMHYEDNAVFSATIGEQEHQLSDELDERFDKLSEAEREYVNGELYEKWKVGSSKFFYTSHEYDRFVLIIDEDKFLSSKRPKLSKQKKQKLVFGPLKLVHSEPENKFGFQAKRVSEANLKLIGSAR